MEVGISLDLENRIAGLAREPVRSLLDLEVSSLEVPVLRVEEEDV